MIDRKGICKAEAMNPIDRVHASDKPERAVGASGNDVARQGYSVIDRAEPRSFFNQNRCGVDTARPVHDGARDDDNGSIIGRFVG